MSCTKRRVARKFVQATASGCNGARCLSDAASAIPVGSRRPAGGKAIRERPRFLCGDQQSRSLSRRLVVPPRCDRSISTSARADVLEAIANSACLLHRRGGRTTLQRKPISPYDRDALRCWGGRVSRSASRASRQRNTKLCGSRPRGHAAPSRTAFASASSGRPSLNESAAALTPSEPQHDRRALLVAASRSRTQRVQ